MKTVITQLNENLKDYPHSMSEFEVIDSPKGIIVTITNRIAPPTPSQYENQISHYEWIISVCAPVSAKMIATHYDAQNKKYGRAQYVYVFAIQENKDDDFSKDDEFVPEPYYLESVQGVSGVGADISTNNTDEGLFFFCIEGGPADGYNGYANNIEEARLLALALIEEYENFQV